MFRTDTSKVILIIGLGIALFIICLAVALVIDTRFSLVPGSNDDTEMLWYFIGGSIFFPGAFRRYRAGRKTEIKTPWYRRLDFILCVIGLLAGLIFALSVIQEWLDYLLISNTSFPQIFIFGKGNFTLLSIANIAVRLFWLTLFVLFIYQAIKQKRNNAKEIPFEQPE